MTEDEFIGLRLKRQREQEVSRLLNERHFTRAVDALETRYAVPLIKDVVHVGENAYGVRLNYASWAALARKLASHLPGTVIPTRHGLVWINGGGGPHGTLIDNTPIDPLNQHDNQTTRLDHIIRARQAMAETGYTGRVPWTLGSIGKRLLKYVSKPMPQSKVNETLFNGIDQGYFRCIPGYYPPDAKMYDVSGYYYNLFARLDAPNRSLRCVIGSNSVAWFPWKDGERERFQEVIRAVASNKPLRNAMVGAAQGSFTTMKGYTSVGAEPGKALAVPIPGRGGPFRAVALLTVRTGWELTQKEALTNNAAYAMIDSVLLTEGTPKVWAAYGLPVQLVHKGDAEVYNRGNYRVGFERKALHRAGFRTTYKETGDLILPYHYSENLL